MQEELQGLLEEAERMSMIIAFILWVFIAGYAKASEVNADTFFIITAIILAGGLAGLGE